MTTDREMAHLYARQEEVIAALHAVGDHDLADRLQCCAAVRRERHHGDGWPRVCRSAACIWCRRPMMRSWWGGFCDWSAAAETSSLAIIQIDASDGLPAAVRRLRRAVRDVRDRAARRWKRWRRVAIAGMIGGDRTALLFVTHEGIDRGEIQRVLHHRWPEVAVKNLEHEAPAFTMSAVDAATLGRHRRGIEPMRLVIMPQHNQRSMAPLIIEPMPILL